MKRKVGVFVPTGPFGPSTIDVSGGPIGAGDGGGEVGGWVLATGAGLPLVGGGFGEPVGPGSGDGDVPVPAGGVGCGDGPGARHARRVGSIWHWLSMTNWSRRSPRVRSLSGPMVPSLAELTFFPAGTSRV